MRIFQVIIAILFVSNYSYAQDSCRAINLIVGELIEGKYFKNTKINTGLTINLGKGLEIDKQYLLYEELDLCSSMDTLKYLLENQSEIIVAYSWKSILSRNPKKALNFFITNYTNLQKREFTEFLNHCQGRVTKSLANYMKYEILDVIRREDNSFSKSDILKYRQLTKKKIRISPYPQPEDF